jgi:cytochrome c-type biogenesis protein CcmH/NrfF
VRLLAAAVAALALAAPAAACVHPASQSKLAAELVCLQCHTTLDESSSPFANQMKADVARQIALCRSERQILDSMVAQFGPTVLSTPQTHGFDLIAWLLPIGGALLGAGALAVGAWYWSRGRDPRDPPAPPALTPEDERLVDEELARF